MADRSLEILDEHNGSYILEAPEHVYVLASGEARLRDLFRTHTDMLDRLKALDSLKIVEFSKITVLDSSKPIIEIGGMIGPGIQVLPGSVEDWGTRSGELQLADVNKALGMDIVVEYLGATTADAVACGDGMNDLEMLEHAGTAVAIEGGNPKVLDVADIVAPGPREAGLAKVFSELGLT